MFMYSFCVIFFVALMELIWQKAVAGDWLRHSAEGLCNICRACCVLPIVLTLFFVVWCFLCVLTRVRWLLRLSWLVKS